MTQAEALGLTLLLEVPLALALARAAGWLPTARLGRLAVVAAAGSFLTHPAAWHGLPALAPHLPWLARVLLVEGGVGLIEGLLLARLVPLGMARGIALGLAINAVSFGIGRLILRGTLLPFPWP